MFCSFTKNYGGLGWLAGWLAGWLMGFYET